MHTEKLLHCNLTLSSHSTKICLKLIRLDSPRSMQWARLIFGNTFGVGIRNRAPNKGEFPRSMHHGDIVNFIDVAINEELTVAQREQEFTFAQGIDFIYNNVKRILKIRVRYNRVEAQADVVQATLRLTEPLQIHNVDVGASRIVPGTMFVRLGELVEVVSVNGVNVILRDDNGVHSTISINEANVLLNDYIG